jgi:ribonuclease R
VSHFVQSGTPLDGGAAQRAFSTYVPGRVAPMLPPELADDLCSLRAGVDRLCVTVEVAPGGGASFYRSVIRSDARLDYGQAQRILSGEEAVAPELAEALVLANGVSEDLRRRRFARGALRIEKPEVQFAFDGHGGVERAWREREPGAHALIEELMILANEQVADLLAGRRREALYRVHERPDPQSIQLLLAKLAALEVPTPPAPERLSSSDAARLAGEISEAIAAYVEHAGRGREAFPSLVLRALKQARYESRNLGHSGLASPAYCHFTSPIRRYPDLVVHRALLRELGLSDQLLPGELEELAVNTSARERETADVEYQADALCAAWLLDTELFQRGWEDAWEGEIIGLIGSGMFVRFGDVFEGYLPLRRLPGWWTLDPTATRLEGQHGGAHRLGDPIEVKVERIDKHNGKVELNPA